MERISAVKFKVGDLTLTFTKDALCIEECGYHLDSLPWSDILGAYETINKDTLIPASRIIALIERTKSE